MTPLLYHTGAPFAIRECDFPAFSDGIGPFQIGIQPPALDQPLGAHPQDEGAGGAAGGQPGALLAPDLGLGKSFFIGYAFLITALILYDNEQIKEDFNELYRQMNGISLQEMDRIIYPVCKLCRDHEKAGFIVGIKIGLVLAQELG